MLHKFYLPAYLADAVSKEKLCFFLFPRPVDCVPGDEIYFVARSMRREPLPSVLDGKTFEVKFVLQDVDGLQPGYVIIGFQLIRKEVTT